jgi:hypothetical protein
MRGAREPIGKWNFNSIESTYQELLAARVQNNGFVSMTTMITELYDALKDAGADEDKARKAAETVAAYENRFAKLDTDIAIVKWMVGFNLAATVALIFMHLHH